MGKKAVKILDISNGDSIEFNEAGLESILLADHVKDLPVVVVSVAGEFRQGKSFLLNFFLRYLRNEGRPNWMDDRRTPLQGFEWRAGSDRHTTGIMLWEEAFVVTRSSGEKVAVLLMDTQGTFDGQSTQRESSTIFSLSVMMSSVQIYNIMRNVGDNHLQQLQFFAEYGRMAQQEAGTPFQQLLFLVRDWPKSFGKSYGAQGGRELLNDRLMTNKGEKEEKRLQREWIESCFSDVGCFLMPSPGEKVAEDETFDGRLEDIKEVFREKVRELVHSVLAPEKLLVKDIDGRKLSCRELATYFKAYAFKFQENSVPEPRSFLEASIEASNVTAVEKARRFYMRGLENTPRRDLAKLLQFHQELIRQTKEKFRSIPKRGGALVSASYLEGLTTELEEYFSRIFREEELAIQNEQAMEAVALDAQRKLEEMQLERAKEIAEAAARYARMEAEVRALKAREEELRKQTEFERLASKASQQELERKMEMERKLMKAQREALQKELEMETRAIKKAMESMQEELNGKHNEEEHNYNMLSGLFMIPAAISASSKCPDKVPSIVRKIEKSFGLPAESCVPLGASATGRKH